LQVVEYLFGQTVGVGVSLNHQRRDSGDEDGLGNAVLAVAGQIAHDFTAASRMADVHRAAQVQLGSQRCQIIGIVVHVVAVASLTGAAVTASIMSDHPEAAMQEEQHLVVPVI
jgi:hypothetical protein